MESLSESTRRSARPNIGVPPVRFPETTDMQPSSFPEDSERTVETVSTSKSTKSSCKSAKTKSTVLKQEIEIDAHRKVLKIQKAIRDKKVELKHAERELVSIGRKLEHMKQHGDQTSDKYAEVLASKLDAMDKVETLTIDLEGLEMTANDEVNLIDKEKELRLEKVDSDDEFRTVDSEERNKEERLMSWVEEQNAMRTSLKRSTENATNSKVVATLDTDRSAMDNGRAQQQHPLYAHQRPVSRVSTGYMSSNSEDSYHQPGSVTPPVLPQTSGEKIMQDLASAIRQLGASSNRSSPMVMKTTVDKDLPKFGGEPGEWIQFQSEFERTTKKYKFDDSENMIRLRKALVGEAKNTVSHLMVNVSNIHVIMDSLEKRFGRPRLVLNSLAAKAKACGNVTTAKPNSIIDFGLAVQALVSNVVSFGEDGYLNSVELLDALVKKLSPELETKWLEWLATDKTNKRNLLGFSKWSSMQLEIAYERSDVKPPEETEEKSERRRKRGSGSVHVATGEEEKCVCCGKNNHSLEKCWKFDKKKLDDRWKLVKASKCCISCLNIGHRSRECSSARVCGIDSCDRKHHRLLHGGKRDKSATEKAEQLPEETNEVSNANANGNFAVITGCDGPLPIVPVKLRGPNGVVRCYALLDSGASRSLLKMSTAEKLGLTGDKIEYSYRGISGKMVTQANAICVDCEISGTLRGSKFTTLQSAVTVDDIKMKPFSMDVGEIKKKFKHLKGVAAKNLQDVVPELIVGNNNPRLILARKVLQGRDTEPIGWRSELGWVISGNFDTMGTGLINIMHGGMNISNEYLHDIVKQSFSFEDFGVKPIHSKGNNLNEKRAYQILENTSKKVDGLWEVGLLWSEDNVKFPESETAALRRLEYTERKMQNFEYKKMYHSKIQEYLQKGYIRKLTPAETAKKSRTTYIIPHFGVTNPNKPGKFRFILDAKAKSHGVALNDKLLKGPDLIRSLVGVLWNFRRHRIALTGDISDMFHRVMIREEDRDAQRFLWRDGESSRAPDHYQMVVMIFGATSSPSSAIFVKNKNASLFKEKYPRAVEVIANDFYVDDCLSGGTSVEEVINLRQQLTEINESGNFSVCKWMSNSEDVLRSIPAELCAPGAKDFCNKEEFPGERVLGMWWNPREDVFQFKLGLHKVKAGILEGDMPTKREMCGLVMSLFDPIGFISHYKIKGLILLQEVWSSGVGWDDEIPFSTYQKWIKWLSRLEEVKYVRIPRHYSQFFGVADNTQLHVLVDASSEAFSAVSYLRFVHGEDVEVAFVGGKARVAPLKKTTIPRLELQAAVMGSRLATSIQEELKIKVSSRFFWSDSSTVLQWLRSRAGKLTEFVANRIGEIQESTNINEWHWIPTKLNVADIATRLDGDISFAPSSEWFQGPSFLKDDPASWNFAETRQHSTGEIGVIALGDGARICSAHSTEEDVNEKPSIAETIPKPQRFSSYWRLVRATAAVKRAAEHWLGRIRKQDSLSVWTNLPTQEGGAKYRSRLRAEDLKRAEMTLFTLAQQDVYGEEVNIVANGGQLKQKGALWRLTPYLDSADVLRVDGRIGLANGVSEDAKNPIILPPRHPITDLLVDAEHRQCAHQGVETVISNLRQRFWIVDARHTVKRSWVRCQLCRLKKCKPVTPKMGNLPSSRLASRQPPFTFCGLDLFGPIEVTVGRHHEKRWGVLFCCMVTRAIHLEVVWSLSTDDLIMALSRFIDCRGRPSHLRSDNGTNFVGASKELREGWKAIDFARIQEHGKFQHIQWSFNPPGAPHMGGVWERLVQSVKKCLGAILREKFPKDPTLLTALKSVENIVNSKPLTYVSSDPFDPQPITPNHILRGSCDGGPSIPFVLDSTENHWRSQWKRSQVLADQFWDRWTKHYLPKLVRREKWLKDVEPIEVGALVYLVDENLPRNCWVRGYVSAVFPGKDGQVRVVDVTTRDATTKKTSCYRRPVTKVCPLGLCMKIQEPEVP